MRAPPPNPRGGIAGVWLVFSIAGAAAGLGLSILSRGPSEFWLGAEPGGGAAIGAGAAVFALLAARVARLALRARDPKGGGDGAHP